MRPFLVALWAVMFAMFVSGCWRNPPYPHAVAPLEVYASRCINNLEALEHENRNNFLVCASLVDKEFNERPLLSSDDQLEVFFGLLSDRSFTAEEIQQSPCAADLTQLSFDQLIQCYKRVHFVIDNLK